MDFTLDKLLQVLEEEVVPSEALSNSTNCAACSDELLILNRLLPDEFVDRLKDDLSSRPYVLERISRPSKPAM